MIILDVVDCLQNIDMGCDIDMRCALYGQILPDTDPSQLDHRCMAAKSDYDLTIESLKWAVD